MTNNWSDSNWGVLAQRCMVIVVALALWEFLPKIVWLQKLSAVFDPFFVSSPSLVFQRVVDLSIGSESQPAMWSYLFDTLTGTFIGVAIGTFLGAFLGLLLSNSPRLQRVFSPFVAILNATPRIALIPIFVILFGPTLTASVVTVVAVVFFIVFYNAYAGGCSVPVQTVQNVRLMGATPGEIMRRVRLPYVIVWTFTSLPNAISFGLVAAVTAEILTGKVGMGRLLLNSIASVDATLTFAVVVVLSVIGVALVTLADRVQRRALHWWERSL